MDGVYGDPYESGTLELRHSQIIRDESWKESKFAFEGYLHILLGAVAIAVSVIFLLGAAPVVLYSFLASMSAGNVSVGIFHFVYNASLVLIHLFAWSKGYLWIRAGMAELTPGPNARDLK